MNIAQSKMNTNFLAALLERRLSQLYTDYFTEIHVNLNDIGYIRVGVGGEIITPFTRAKKNRHGTPNFWYRASFTRAGR